jgi:hypothetical protein
VKVSLIEERKIIVSQCQQPVVHPDKLAHRRSNEFVSYLDERQKRWYVALESQKRGYGGDKLMSEITGLTEIRQGRKEIETGMSRYPLEKKRAKGSGRFLTEKKISPD